MQITTKSKGFKTHWAKFSVQKYIETNFSLSAITTLLLGCVIRQCGASISVVPLRPLCKTGLYSRVVGVSFLRGAFYPTHASVMGSAILRKLVEYWLYIIPHDGVGLPETVVSSEVSLQRE